MEILDDDINAEIIGFGALNVDKLYSVANIAGKDEESFITAETDSPGSKYYSRIIKIRLLYIFHWKNC